MGGAFSSSSSGDAKSKKSAKATSSSQQITDVDRAILDLKNTRDRLTKYNNQLETSIEKLMLRAKQAKQEGKTSTALGLLRLKKYKQTQVEQVQTQLLNVHEMIGTIDSQQQNIQLVQSMKAGKDALAKLHKETTVESVLDLMDEIQEQHAVEEEITNIINDAVPSLTADQELAVEAELEAMALELGLGDEPAKDKVENDSTLEMPKAPEGKLPEPQAKPQKQQSAKKAEPVPIAG